MNTADMLFVAEFLGTFGLVIGFCLWQLHSLNKLDREEAREKAKLQKPSE